TGSGGTEYTLAFLGLQRYAGVGDTLRYSAIATATDDENRQGLTRIIKAGLIPFVARTTLAGRMQFSMAAAAAGESQAAAQTQHDPWNFWVFSTSFNGFANGDKN